MSNTWNHVLQLLCTDLRVTQNVSSRELFCRIRGFKIVLPRTSKCGDVDKRLSDMWTRFWSTLVHCERWEMTKKRCSHLCGSWPQCIRIRESIVSRSWSFRWTTCCWRIRCDAETRCMRKTSQVAWHFGECVADVWSCSVFDDSSSTLLCNSK